MRVLAGRDPHHIVEAQFKAFARALRDAVALDPREAGVPSHQGRALTAARDVVVLDYGSGNLRSAVRALERAGADVTLTADRDDGARRRRPRRPRRRRLRRLHGAGCARSTAAAIIGRRLAGGRPVLGICVGMQVLFERGVEHGVETEGCGEWPGRRRAAAGAASCRTWAGTPSRSPEGSRAVRRRRGRAVLLRALLRRARLGRCVTSRRTPAAAGDLGRARGDRFVAAVENGPLSATQFHPEKSGDAGAALLRNWVGTLPG